MSDVFEKYVYLQLKITKMYKETSRFKLEIELEVGYVPIEKERRIDAAKKVLQETENYIRKYVEILDRRAKDGRMLPDIDIKTFSLSEIV